MVFTILVPEYIIGREMSEVLAVNGMIKVNKDKRIDGSIWDKGIVHMADIGYFVLDFGEYWLSSSSGDINRTVEDQSLFEIGEFCSEAAEPGYSLKETVEDILQDHQGAITASGLLNLSRLTHPYWVLTALQLDFMIPDIVDMLNIPVRHLELLNRGDILVKVLALVQIVYLIVQVIARKVAGLPSAQLEIGALAFSASGFIT